MPSLTDLINMVMPSSKAVTNAPYQMYVKEQMALGQRPLPMDQWMRMQQAQAQQTPAQPAPVAPPAAPVNPQNPAGIQF